MDDQVKEFMAEGYKRFPDDVEPIDDHPAGKITVDRGNLRYAFLEGALFAVMQRRKEDEEDETYPARAARALEVMKRS